MGKENKFERLLHYLSDPKTTFAMKKAAAEQIGTVQNEFSFDLTYLLRKIYPILMLNEFDCQCGAALAIRKLIPNCKQRSLEWKTNRPLATIDFLNINDILKTGHKLTHEVGDKTITPISHKSKIFESTNPNISELCELCDHLVKELKETNWYYRHGAVIGLTEILGEFVPINIIEDMIVELGILIATDDFIDTGVSDTIKFPVRGPACKLLGKLLMRNSSWAMKVIPQLLDKDKDWKMHVCGWLVIDAMTARDSQYFDFNWLFEQLIGVLDSQLEDLEDDLRQDTTSVALHAVLPFIENFDESQRIEISNKVWALFSSVDEIAAFNSIAILVIEKLLRECNVSDFTEQNCFETIMKLTEVPQDETRSAAYRLLHTMISMQDLDIWSDADLNQFSLNLALINIREQVTELSVEADGLLKAYKELLEYNGFELAEDYVVFMCQYIAGNKEYLAKLGKVITVLINVSGYVTISKENPVFRDITSAIAVALIIIMCLYIGTAKPTFAGISPRIFATPPVPMLMSLFDFKAKKAPKKVDEILEIKEGPFRIFVSRYIGKAVYEAKRDDTVEALVERASEDEKFLPSNLVDNSFASAVEEQRPTLQTFILDTILKEAVYDVPAHFDSKHSLLQVLFLVMAKKELSEESVLKLIATIKNEDRYIASFAAYVASKYAAMSTERFIVPYILEMEKPDFVFTASDAEFADLFLSKLPFDKITWVSFFVPTLLKHMAWPDEEIREYSAHALAQVVRLLPLERIDIEALPEEVREVKMKSINDLKMLFDPSVAKNQNLVLDPPPQVELKDYQEDGVKWLKFLEETGLNGILADDMGLGKTLQSLCAIVSAHRAAGDKCVSLVVAPPNVVHHWENEVKKFFPHMEVFADTGAKNTRREDGRLETIIGKLPTFQGILVTSYKYAAKNAEILSRRLFKYLILDEGHIIKNSKSQLAIALTKLRAEHRLILSGTPVQNNTIELWSLFNFLMPGYLGSDKLFRKAYELPIQRMFKPGVKEAETERGQRALEDLHSQVLPFIMRRLKTDVLDDLLPISLMTETCQMSDVQKNLLREKKEDEEDEDAITNEEKENFNESSFERFRRQRLINIHPCLFDANVPRELRLSGKLQALRDLLLRLGIGADEDDDSVVPTKAVIFCELNEAVDMIAELVMPQLKGAEFVTLTSKLSAETKKANINRFQTDNGPDVFIATKAEGSLGIELTQASVCILFELNWNPSVDDQARSRLHRLGQRKQVVVFTLICEGTIDERIVEIQNVKRTITSAIIHDDNKGLETMSTDGVLGRINAEPEPKTKMSRAEELAQGIGYDQKQYEQMDSD